MYSVVVPSSAHPLSVLQVCPILARAMKDRSSEVKKKASQIVGSIVLLIQDPKDVTPYRDRPQPDRQERQSRRDDVSVGQDFVGLPLI